MSAFLMSRGFLSTAVLVTPAFLLTAVSLTTAPEALLLALQPIVSFLLRPVVEKLKQTPYRMEITLELVDDQQRDRSSNGWMIYNHLEKGASQHKKGV